MKSKALNMKLTTLSVIAVKDLVHSPIHVLFDFMHAHGLYDL